MSSIPNAIKPNMGIRPFTISNRLHTTLSLTTYISVLLLITMGSIVRVSGNGLGCPDWPLCYGQLLPPLALSPWVEFTHRLLGAISSVQILALAVIAWRQHSHNAWVIRPAIISIFLLLVQILLGGLHVIFELPAISGLLHTATAMAIAVMVVIQFAALHPLSQRLTQQAPEVRQRDRGLPIAMLTTAALLYALIMTGSYVTRSGASLACPAFPHCGADESAVVFPALVNIQMLHRLTAFGVALTICISLARLARAAKAVPMFNAPAIGLALLVLTQFGLGIANVWLRLPMWSRSLHLLVATLLLTGTVWLGSVLRRKAA